MFGCRVDGAFNLFQPHSPFIMPCCVQRTQISFSEASALVANGWYRPCHWLFIVEIVFPKDKQRKFQISDKSSNGQFIFGVIHISCVSGQRYSNLLPCTYCPV